jgi:anti-sigma B factor antagonist
MEELKTGSKMVPTIRKEGDAIVLSLRGEIDLHNSPEVRTVLLDLLSKHKPKRLVLNLADVPYMDSSAIAVLVEGMQKLRKDGGKIYLTNLQPRVRGLLEIARLDTIFVLVNDEQDALKK